MPLDPRYSTLSEHLERARCAMLANDEQLILENLYHLREVAWDINASILAKRWSGRERPQRRIPTTRPVATLDDLFT
jgi:hypothetical protein